jgi:hypothetical protein
LNFPEVGIPASGTPTTSIQNASARLPERSRIQPLTARNSIVFWVDLAASSDQRVRQRIPTAKAHKNLRTAPPGLFYIAPHDLLNSRQQFFTDS